MVPRVLRPWKGAVLGDAPRCRPSCLPASLQFPQEEVNQKLRASKPVMGPEPGKAPGDPTEPAGDTQHRHKKAPTCPSSQHQDTCSYAKWSSHAQPQFYFYQSVLLSLPSLTSLCGHSCARDVNRGCDPTHCAKGF